MFQQFLKRQSHVFHIQVWPDRIKISELTSSRAVEDVPVIAFEANDGKKIVKGIGKAAQSLGILENVTMMNPFYSEGCVLSDIDGAVAVINHQLHLLTQELPGKIFSPLMIFQPMQFSEKGLGSDGDDVAGMLSQKCGARNVIIMEPDEYLDLDGVA